ncbi:MAG: PAS domain S-box protein [Planctomycetota bacterium]|jgi:PAS domain S-box-containing protein
MHPVAYIELISALACLTAVVFVVSAWKRPGFLRAIPMLLVLLLLLMMFYGLALFLEWSGLAERFHWHFIEDFASVFIPFVWAFVFYAIVKNTVEKELRASRRYFRNLVESTSDWIWEVDAEGRYTYVSPRVEAILGYTPEEVLGKTPFDLMGPEEAERIRVLFVETAGRQEPFHDIINFNLHKDGHEVVLETNGMPVLDNKGNLTGYRGIDRDITTRLKVEREQKQQQAEMDSVFRASPAGIGLIRNRKMVRGNERFFEITGYPENEQIGMDPRQFYQSDEDYLAVGEKYAEAMATGFARIETQFVRKDQTVIDVVFYISPLDRGDAAAGFAVVMQDITEFKAARQEAIAEKTRAQTYLDVVNVVILVLDNVGNVKLINKKGCELLGRSADQIQGVDWFNVCLPPSYRQISRSAFQRVIDGDEKSVTYFENPVLTAKGAERLIAWRNAALRDASGKIVGVISSGLDITESRNAEEALRISEQRLRVALSSAQMGTWRWEAATGLLTRDANLNMMLGLEEKEIIERVDEFFKFVHLEDQVAAKTEFQRAIVERDTFLSRFRVVRPDTGAVRFVLDQGKPFYDFNGQLEYMTGVVVDVTEQTEYQMRYQNIIDSAPMGILTYELDADDCLVLTGANQAADTILGVKFSTSVGKTIEEVFPEISGTELPKEYRRICKEGGVYHGDNFEYRDERVGGFYEFDAFQTSPGNVAVAFMDITERKQAEHQREELMRKLQFTQFAFDNAGEAAEWVDFDENYIYVNDMVCEELGYTREELMQMKVNEIDPFYPREDWEKHWDEMREIGVKRFEGRHVRKDGTIIPVEITSKFVTYEGKEYICSFERDITERKVAQQKREVLAQQIQNRNDELQSIVFAAAHDLRTPLVNIAGFSGELEKSLAKLTETLGGVSFDAEVAEQIDFLLKTDVPESLRFIKLGNQQMDMLLGGLMRLSRVGTAPVKETVLDMYHLLDSVVQGFQYKINTLDIDLSIQEDIPDCIGDYSLMSQVFINLLDNAIKYSHPDRKAVIKMTGTVQDEMVEYAITDNGIGIEPDQQDKVFDLFHQLHIKPDAKGQGLGLTIVRRIMDRQQGSVEIDSTAEEGTTIFVRLPRA